MKTLKENVENHKKNGLIPSMNFRKGKTRWQITYVSGETEEIMSSQKVKQKVEAGNIIKVEKKRFVVVLNGNTKKDFVLQEVERRDVSSLYLGK